MNTSNILSSFIEKKDFISYFESKKAELFKEMKEDLADEISVMTLTELMTISLKRGDQLVRNIKPAANKEYAAALIAFLRKKEYDSLTTDSYLTPIIIKTVEDCIADFYSSPQHLSKVAHIFEGEISKVQKATTMGKNYLDGFGGSKFLASAAIKTSTEELVEGITTAVGAKVVTVLAATPMTTLVPIIMSILKSSLIMGTLKPIILKVLGKIGIGFLVKTAIGKVFLAVLGLASVSSTIPVMWILMPLLAGFLVYEVSTLPDKLAEKVPNQIIEELSASFDEMNELIVNEMISAVSSEIERKIV